jgi:putative ABC transport system permease protein
MKVLEAVALAFSGLNANRLRSALTMLGILIGVAAVIMLVAVGNGASVQIQNQIQGLGSNVVYVYPGAVKSSGVSQGFGSGSSLSQADVDALNDKTQAPDVVTAVPIAGVTGIMVYQNQNWFANASGATADFAQVRNYDIAQGSMFSDSDVRSASKVVVIGQTVVDNLFGGNASSAVGQTIKILRQPFRVVGVFASKGSQGFGANQDNVAVVPITAAWDYLAGGRNKNISYIICEASSPDTVKAANDEITATLLNRHKIGDPSLADFQTQTQQDILNSANQATAIFTVVLGAIAGISLVVGGIGIMNIMLVTVTERTREIGIRKAIGARRTDVLLQFLIESMVLSGLGGILGIVAGAGAAAWVGTFSSRLGNFPPPVVSGPSVLLAFGVSVGIGLFFGIYPANRAASLNPIEALRYE